MSALIIFQPTPNQLVTAGQPFPVNGRALDRGMPEPVMIDSVTVQVDDGPLIDADLTQVPHQVLTTFSFTAEAEVPGIPGPHIIHVTANDEQGVSTRKTVTVFVEIVPLDATFNGIATLTTTYGMAPGPFFDSLMIFLEFSADRQIVTITSFPPIVTVSSKSGATITVTITEAGGGVGMFNLDTGAITVPLTLSFDILVQLGPITIHHGTSTLALLLSTAPPTGTPLQNDGTISLVGSGTFSGDVLGGSNASLVLTGTISPHP